SCRIRKILQSLTLPSTSTLNPGESFEPVPQDEDEREPRFIQAHDLDFVPEPVYPEYIPLEDEHVLPAEEQPLPPVDSPTTESLRYVAESDPEEDPEYEDDEEQDGLDEDMEEEEEDEEGEKEHIASSDSTAVIPVVELISSPEGTKPVLPPPFIDITTTGARILVRIQASISLPSTALRITSTQALIDAVTAALPSSSVDRKDEIPESEMPPRKRSCLFTIGSRVFWGTDEEVSEGGVPRVIVYGYDGFPIQPVPQDEDEHEPRFIQAHDPDFVPEPVYPEYIPLEDEHVLPAEEQPLPPVDSPTTESLRYVAEDDAANENEDMEEEEEDEEEEKEHIASANSIVVIPVVELISSPEGTKHVLPPPFIDITTMGPGFQSGFRHLYPSHLQ
nr:hypothetical protein [Tanacetum cinerariifolium]